jgi:hypothetical protein
MGASSDDDDDDDDDDGPPAAAPAALAHSTTRTRSRRRTDNDDVCCRASSEASASEWAGQGAGARARSVSERAPRRCSSSSQVDDADKERASRVGRYDRTRSCRGCGSPSRGCMVVARMRVMLVMRCWCVMTAAAAWVVGCGFRRRGSESVSQWSWQILHTDWDKTIRLGRYVFGWWLVSWLVVKVSRVSCVSNQGGTR